METISWPCRVKNGVPIVLAQSLYLKHLRGLEGKRCVLTVSEYKDPKADALRKYYFSQIMRLCAKESGHTEEELHNLMKQQFNYKDVMNQRVGMPVFRKGSGLNDDDKKAFIRQVRSWALDFLKVKTEPFGYCE